MEQELKDKGRKGEGPTWIFFLGPRVPSDATGYSRGANKVAISTMVYRLSLKNHATALTTTYYRLITRCDKSSQTKQK